MEQPDVPEVFARVLNIPTRTVQSWEDGTRRPSQAALRLIQVFREKTAGVLEVVGMTIPQTPASPKKRRADRLDHDDCGRIAGRRGRVVVGDKGSDEG